jgi:lysophospholipase L1-like esterase
MKKKILFYITLVAINLTGIALLLLLYFSLIFFNIITTPKFISKNKVYRKIYSSFFFSKKEQKLLKIMDDNYYDFYPAMELGGDYEHLSKKLFDFPEIDGVKTFMHKPNIKKLMTILPLEEVRSLRSINFSLPYDVKLKNMIDDLVVNNTRNENLKFYSSTAGEFNNMGFRKNVFSNTKNLPDILFAGDSYTEGLYVNNNETFVHDLGILMNNENFAYPVNTGCNGYGTINEYLIIKEYALKFNAHAVFLLHCFNDIFNNQDAVFKGNAPELKKAWEDNFKLLDKINMFCKENNIPLIISAFPNLYQNINTDVDSRKNYQEKLADYCKNNKIIFIDVFNEIKSKIKINPRMLKKDSNEAEFNDNNFYEEKFGENIYMPFDDHLSAYGNRLFADAIWQKIKELDIKLDK